MKHFTCFCTLKEKKKVLIKKLSYKAIQLCVQLDWKGPWSLGLE